MIEVKPATASRWSELAELFGPKGACAGCWCMWCRKPASEFSYGRGEQNRRALKSLVDKGAEPGLIAYEKGRPVGWAALGPREEFRRLARARILKPLDERPAWSVPCLFVAREHRGRGVATALLKAAAKRARARGAKLIEGYPVDTRGKKSSDAFIWWGTVSAFKKAGFSVVKRPSKARAIVRKELR